MRVETCPANITIKVLRKYWFAFVRNANEIGKKQQLRTSANE